MNNEEYTLVILHGWGHSKNQWNFFINRFDEGNVVIFDLPGFGEEKLIDQNWGIPEYSMWAKAKIESLGEKNVVLLGHSFGGRIAGYIASENPPWLKGLILYGSPSLYRPGKKVRFKILVAKFLKGLGFSKKIKDKFYITKKNSYEKNSDTLIKLKENNKKPQNEECKCWFICFCILWTYIRFLFFNSDICLLNMKNVFNVLFIY